METAVLRLFWFARPRALAPVSLRYKCESETAGYFFSVSHALVSQEIYIFARSGGCEMLSHCSF